MAYAKPNSGLSRRPHVAHVQAKSCEWNTRGFSCGCDRCERRLVTRQDRTIAAREVRQGRELAGLMREARTR